MKKAEPGDVPEFDPAADILAGILRLVPVSHWTFARVEPSGELVSLRGAAASDEAKARLTDEFKRQRTKAPLGKRIAATLGPLDVYASGITLLFADARSSYGILTLLRDAELSPFTSTEITMLTIALDAFSDRLSALRLQPLGNETGPSDDYQENVNSHPDDAFYVLDRDMQIVLAWNAADQRRVAATGLHTRVADRLPIVLEETVRQLTTAWFGDASDAAGSARPVPFLVVRTEPLSGPMGLFIGVHIDRFMPPNSLTRAAERFRISPREAQVLALLLDGRHLNEIAERLYITSSTVQDHIKSMLEKTGSGNRSELIARVLGWEAASTQRNV